MALKSTKSPYARPRTVRVIPVEKNDMLTSAAGLESIKDTPTEYDWDPEF